MAHPYNKWEEKQKDLEKIRFMSDPGTHFSFFFFSTMIIYDGHDSSEAIVTVDLTRILVTRINKQEDARKIYSRATKKYTREIIDYRAIHEKVARNRSFLSRPSRREPTSMKKESTSQSKIFLVARH